MTTLSQPDLTDRRNRIRAADSSFELTETVADMLVDVAGQASDISAWLNAIATKLDDTKANLGTLATATGHHLHSLAQRGTHDNPLHVRVHDGSSRMMVELHPAAFEGLAVLLQELRIVTIECSRNVTESNQVLGRHLAALVTTNAETQERFAALERQIAACRARIDALSPARQRTGARK